MFAYLVLEQVLIAQITDMHVLRGICVPEGVVFRVLVLRKAVHAKTVPNVLRRKPVLLTVPTVEHVVVFVKAELIMETPVRVLVLVLITVA